LERSRDQARRRRAFQAEIADGFRAVLLHALRYFRLDDSRDRERYCRRSRRAGLGDAPPRSQDHRNRQNRRPPSAARFDDLRV